MTTLTVLLLLCAVSVATEATEGMSNSEDWAYQWYTGESFRFQCQTSGLNLTADHYVVWDTPTRKALPTGYDDTDYKLSTADGIRDAELLIKDVQSGFHGVYTCNMHEQNTAEMKGKVIYGLNIRDKKYHDLVDKYRHNVVVAFIATAVFLGPAATIVLVHYFQYEERVKRKQGGYGGKAYLDGHELKEPMQSGGIAAAVESAEGKRAYENPIPDLSTQL